MEFALILAIGLVAGTISGIVGFDSSIMLMPVLVIVFGPLKAVPIMAVAALMANFSRILVWWREVDWRANAAYCATAVPAAALGARTLIALDARMVETALGVFLIAVVPVRRWLTARGWTLNRARKTTMVVASCCMPVWCLLIVQVPNPALALVFASAAMFCT